MSSGTDGEQGGRRGDDPLDVDAAWADIVANWGPLQDDDETPDAGSATGTGDPSAAPAGPATTGPRSRVLRSPSWSEDADGSDDTDAPVRPTAPAGPRDHGLAEEDEGDFVPPEPPPIGPGDPLNRLCWLGAVGAPVFMLICALAWRSVPGWLVSLAIAAFLVGSITLVVRMPREHDDPNDGAVV